MLIIHEDVHMGFFLKQVNLFQVHDTNTLCLNYLFSCSKIRKWDVDAIFSKINVFLGD